MILAWRIPPATFRIACSSPQLADCSDSSDEAGCTEKRNCGPFGFMHCPSGVCTHVFVRDKGYDPPAVVRYTLSGHIGWKSKF
jgi:hypothetical protein